MVQTYLVPADRLLTTRYRYPVLLPVGASAAQRITQNCEQAGTRYPGTRYMVLRYRYRHNG